MLITHVQLHELLADCCYHAAITPASVQANFEHEHLLLVPSYISACRRVCRHYLHVCNHMGAGSYGNVKVVYWRSGSHLEH